MIFQAGTSRAGQAFAAKHAEAIYIGGLVPSQASYQIKAIRDIARAANRDPYSIKVFAAINPILGRTVEEAQAKYEDAMEYADVEGALAQFSGYTSIDMSKFPLDEELRLDTSNPKESAAIGFLGNFIDSVKEGSVWTPRKLGQKIAVGGFHPTPVGTPEMVADVMEQVRCCQTNTLRRSTDMHTTLIQSQWIDEADVDGFNMAYISNPGSWVDIVELLVPELKKRGLMFDDYAVPGGTFRENLLRQPGQKTLRSDHYGSQFTFDAEMARKET